MSDSTSTPETESTPDSATGSDATNDQVDPGSDWDGDATSHGIIAPDSWSHTPDDDIGEFFVNDDGTRTLAGPEDLRATVPNHDSEAMEEIERYWLDKPYSFCVIYHARDKNEHLYYVVEPYLDEDERRLKQFFDNQIQNNIRYDDVPLNPTELEQQRIIRDTFYELLQRYSMVRRGDLSGDAGVLSRGLDRVASLLKRRTDKRRANRDTLVSPPSLSDSDNRGDGDTISGRLTPHQVAKLAYYLIRDSVGRDKIEPLKQDRRIEDVNCDAPGVEVFIDHAEHEQLITNITFQEDELDRLIEKLANRAGKGISRRQPTVDATLPDGARAQLTLSDETTTKGSNFTIRQFRDVPFTPVDLISWETYNLDQLAYLWLCIESGKSVIFAGGTSSGKTTTLNALSLFIPGAAEKIVSIEDTPELELPQKNWIQQTTREPFAQDGADAIEEIDLLTTALRQNPDYIVMGEVRSEEGSVLFQGMSSGHTCFTTFHASNPSQVIKRFVSDDIGVSREFFNELDIIVNQQEVRVDDEKVRRNTRITEIGAYEQDANQVRRRQLFTWDAHSDSFIQSSPSNLLEEIREGRGWSMARMEWELLKRQAVLAYLAANNIQSYRAVATTIQAVLSEEVNILKLIADRELQDRLDDLSEMRSVHLDVSEEEEESVPRPDIPAGVREDAEDVLADVMPYLQQMKTEAQKQDEAATGQRTAAQYIPEVRDASVTDRLEGSRAVDIEWTSPKVDEDVEGVQSTARTFDSEEFADISLEDLDPEARELLIEHKEAAEAAVQSQPATTKPDESDHGSAAESPAPEGTGQADSSDHEAEPVDAEAAPDEDAGDADDEPSPEFELNSTSQPDDPFATETNGTDPGGDAGAADEPEGGDDADTDAGGDSLGEVYDSSMGPDPDDALDSMRASVDGRSDDTTTASPASDQSPEGDDQPAGATEDSIDETDTDDDLQRDPVVEPPEPDGTDTDPGADSPGTDGPQEGDTDAEVASTDDDPDGEAEPAQPAGQESGPSTNGTDEAVDVELDADTLLDDDAEESGISITAPSSNGEEAPSDIGDDSSSPSSDAQPVETADAGDDSPAVEADGTEADTAATPSDNAFDFGVATADEETGEDASASPEGEDGPADTEPVEPAAATVDSEDGSAEADEATDLTESIPDAVGSDAAPPTAEGDGPTTDTDDADGIDEDGSEADVESPESNGAETEEAVSADDAESAGEDDDTDPEEVVDELFGGADSTEDTTTSPDDGSTDAGEDAGVTSPPEPADKDDDWDPDDIFSDSEADDDEEATDADAEDRVEEPDATSVDADTTSGDTSEDGREEPDSEDETETEISEDEPTDMEELVEDVFEEPGGD